MQISDAVAMIREISTDGRPWLLVGKGPSLDRRHEYDLRPYHVLTLNHACRVVIPSVAHFTDLEPLLECVQELAAGHKRIVAPWHPHVDFRPSPNNLGDYVRNGHDELAAAVSRKLLYAYNSTRARTKVAWLTTVPVRYFSAVAGLNLLALAGVRSVVSLGVDGGTKYAKDFDSKDRLANGRTSFDVQFTEMKKTVDSYHITYRSLTGGHL